MKYILSFLFALSITLPIAVFSQTPTKINYQAVARDAGGNVIANQNVGLRTSVLQGSATGTAVFVETHTPTTNNFGLFNIQIGGGTTVTVSPFDWNTDEYYLKVELDIAGGTNYVEMGTSQFISVPYAFHANTANNVLNDAVNDADSDPTNEIELPSGAQEGQVLKIVGGQPTWVDEGCDLAIGDTYQGGIIFYLDETGCHGLMCAPSDQSSNLVFKPIPADGGFTGSRGDGLGAGRMNTAVCVTHYEGYEDFSGCAANVCAKYTLTSGGVEYGDWYLPSLYELELMYNNVGQGNALGLGNVANFAFDVYWSSIESGTAPADAWRFYFVTGTASLFDKEDQASVRAIRAF